MIDPTDPLFIEACFPGAITGQAEVSCPICETLLTVPVSDPIGEETYRCGQCGGIFVANWADESQRAL